MRGRRRLDLGRVRAHVGGDDGVEGLAARVVARAPLPQLVERPRRGGLRRVARRRRRVALRAVLVGRRAQARQQLAHRDELEVVLGRCLGRLLRNIAGRLPGENTQRTAAGAQGARVVQAVD